MGDPKARLAKPPPYMPFAPMGMCEFLPSGTSLGGVLTVHNSSLPCRSLPATAPWRLRCLSLHSSESLHRLNPKSRN